MLVFITHVEVSNTGRNKKTCNYLRSRILVAYPMLSDYICIVLAYTSIILRFICGLLLVTGFTPQKLPTCMVLLICWSYVHGLWVWVNCNLQFPNQKQTVFWMICQTSTIIISRIRLWCTETLETTNEPKSRRVSKTCEQLLQPDLLTQSLAPHVSLGHWNAAVATGWVKASEILLCFSIQRKSNLYVGVDQNIVAGVLLEMTLRPPLRFLALFRVFIVFHYST